MNNWTSAWRVILESEIWYRSNVLLSLLYEPCILCWTYMFCIWCGFIKNDIHSNNINFSEEYTAFLRCICTPGEWQTITAIYATTGALEFAIQTSSPHINFALADCTRKVCGRNVGGRKKVTVYIMFTMLGYVDSRKYNTNHYVPLCKTQYCHLLQSDIFYNHNRYFIIYNHLVLYQQLSATL